MPTNRTGHLVPQNWPAKKPEPQSSGEKLKDRLFINFFVSSISQLALLGVALKYVNFEHFWSGLVYSVATCTVFWCHLQATSEARDYITLNG